MRRQPRLDAPGTLHHVIGRGIEKRNILRNEGDKKDFMPHAADVLLLFCRIAVERMGYPAAEVALFLGVTTSAVVRAAHSEGHPEIEKYL